MINQSELNEYFNTSWRGSMDVFRHSGWALVEKVNPGESVLDVGCGFNVFKEKIPNLVGIDPANDAADFRVSIEEFSTDKKFDVAFCLGSINFGKESNIINQIKIVVDLLKPDARIYWRSNPGLTDHGNTKFNKFEVYPWSLEKHLELSALFGFDCPVVLWDSRDRIYAEWTRSATV